jgi:hypothetical protein
MLLTDILPQLALELELLLKEHEESELAAQVSTLAIVDRCHVAMTFALLSILSRSQREPTAPTTVALT